MLLPQIQNNGRHYFYKSALLSNGNAEEIMYNLEQRKVLKQIQGLKGRVQNSLSGFIRACIVALLVLFQFIILLGLPFLLRQYSTFFYIAMEFLHKGYISAD